MGAPFYLVGGKEKLQKALLMNNYHCIISNHFFHNFSKNIILCVFFFFEQTDGNPRRNINFRSCGLERAELRRLQTKFAARPEASATPTVLTN